MTGIGKHFIVGIQGTKLTEAEKSLWKEIRPLGVIIFRRNISQSPDWQKHLRELITELKELSAREEFVSSIDHEGGRVHRLSPPITAFQPANSWRENSFAVGAAMGKELNSLGINLNFAPSFDVLTEPTNIVIGKRAFSSDANEVLKSGLKFLDGLESEGVLGCAKHFPGHGGTVSDSHHELPVVATSQNDLFERELVPFKGYIDSGRELIMTAHVLYNALDAENPGTLSKKILTGLLRDKLGYKGAIITDALDMRALEGISEAEVAEKFISAGGDLFCVCQDTQDKKVDGRRLSPIEAAALYAESLSSNISLKAQLERSATAIDRFLTQFRKVCDKKAVELTNEDYQRHAALNNSLSDSITKA
jgi:beta-N-acetylhexosaminidase